MAIFKCNHMSEAMHRHMEFNVILPEGLNKEDIPTLYLLHGLSDDQDAWLTNTIANIYASERGIAIVMPDACTSFYSDTVSFENYFTYISKEVVEYTRKVFRLSEKREKTYVSGNSMGGYGAAKCALNRPDLFGGCITFSGTLDIVSLVNAEGWMKEISLRTWGSDCKETVKDSSSDLFSLVRKLNADANSLKPRIMQICGTEDFLYQENLAFKALMEKTNFEYRYHEGKGGHTWHFWNEWLPTAIDFMLETV